MFLYAFWIRIILMPVPVSARPSFPLISSDGTSAGIVMSSASLQYFISLLISFLSPGEWAIISRSVRSISAQRVRVSPSYSDVYI